MTEIVFQKKDDKNPLIKAEMNISIHGVAKIRKQNCLSRHYGQIKGLYMKYRLLCNILHPMISLEPFFKVFTKRGMLV